jgi:hypothetical protein
MQRLITAVIALAAWTGAAAQNIPLFDPAAGLRTPPFKPAVSYAVHLPGVSRHMEQTRAMGQTWNEQHPALALELRDRFAAAGWEHWTRKRIAGTMQDSRARWGAYAGMAAHRELATISDWRIYGGPFAGLFYRSKNWSGHMWPVPVVLPTFAIEKGGGLGLNVVVAPAIKSRSAIFFGQLTYRLP